MSQKTIMDRLARYRTIGARNSEEVLELGTRALSSGGLGDQEWAVREQVAIAAMDLGQLDQAQQQVSILLKKFSDSPRIAILRGLKLEAEGNYEAAARLYRSLLGRPVDDKGKGKVEGGIIWKGEPDETMITAHQRLITLSLFPSTSPASTSPSPEAISQTIPLLVAYLDTFHTDPDAWSLLADLYLLLSGWSEIDNAYARGELVQKYFPGSRLGGEAEGKGEKSTQYLQQAMTCLSHRLTMEPWNWMSMARYGEAALMFGDVSLAYKTFLRAIEMATDPSDALVDVKVVGTDSISSSTNLLQAIRSGGWKTRVWWDLKLCTTYLSSEKYDPSINSLSPTPPEHVDIISRLVDQKLSALVDLQALEIWKRDVVV